MHPLWQLINAFVPLTETEWLMLYEHCEEITIDKGKCFIKEGQKEKRVGFILEGTMRQYYSRANGEETTTYFYFENNLVSSYISCITVSPSLMTIEALEKTKLLVFPYSLLEALFENENNGKSSAEKWLNTWQQVLKKGW